MKVLILEDGFARLSQEPTLRFRAYQEGHPLTPLLVGEPPAPIVAETVEECSQAVLIHYPKAEILVPVHEHHPAAVHSTPSPPGLRKTGVHQEEVCRCGMKRHVWITTFKIDAGAWQ